MNQRRNRHIWVSENTEHFACLEDTIGTRKMGATPDAGEIGAS